ncbi:MAG: UDP-N-acetylmuramoyl-tripeptide--D-alanyl-D-alanine ligase [Pedobacter sp.]|nr:MAG: UDP-N-acetylmuramoyl-tripeptide--D-alanyl-D-alanine ligase [Pedobacter sp.]
MSSIESIYQIYLKHSQICTDTRKIIPGGIFFALKGDNFDANNFASQALEQGAEYVIIDNPKAQLNNQCILVDDVLTTLQELAKKHRAHFKIPFIGLTGSNGKTTSKELIQAVLQEKFKSHATVGNLNNHIGVPLTILSMPLDTEIAIIEMGANHQKEIAFLCEIAQPTHGLITNIGMAHLEGFGGFEGVKKGKSELYQYLQKENGTIFLDSNNTILIELCKALNLQDVITYGTQPDNDIQGELLENDPFLKIQWKGGCVATQLTGAYNFSNILAAIAIGDYFDVSVASIQAGLSSYSPKNNRSQIEKTANNTIICDFYNANPSSMEVALQNLAKLNSPHKTIILGDMFELGPETQAQHQRIHDLALSLDLDHYYFIGNNFAALDPQDKAHYFNTPSEALKNLTILPLANQLILLKGSRGMALEQLMPVL